MIGSALVFGDKPIGQGGISAAWLAAFPGEKAAVPAVFRHLTGHAQDSPELVTAFLRTARYRRQLQGAGTVPRVFDAFKDNEGRTCTVEEFVGDVGLQELLRTRRESEKPLPLGFAIRLARTLAAMHEATGRLVPDARCEWSEKDVRLGWDGAIRVLVDDGPMWDEMSHGAAAGMLRSHFSLMAPEQIRGMSRSHLSAMYGVGVLMFEALTGRHPIHEGTESDLERLQRSINEEVPSPSVLRSGIPHDLTEVVLRCTRRKVEDRYPSWMDLLDVLNDLSQQVERFGDEHLAWILQEHYAARAKTWHIREQAIALIDLAGFTHGTAIPLPLPPLTSPAAAIATMSPASVDLDLEGAVWGSDARPALRAGGLIIDVRPVTNAEYARFVTAEQIEPPPHWNGPLPPPQIEDLPVTFVSHNDAGRYAAWAGKRLPTWKEWRDSVAELGGLRLSTGQVWEWTLTPFRDGWAVCGGRWRDRPDEPPDAGNESYASHAAADVGFRCVCNIHAE